ncbi:unnamed protein product, partial [Musa acuminata subsp. burmannicoides]
KEGSCARDRDTHGCPATPPETDARHRIRQNHPTVDRAVPHRFGHRQLRHVVKKREAVSNHRSDVQANKREEAARKLSSLAADHEGQPMLNDCLPLMTITLMMAQILRVAKFIFITSV